MAHNGSMAGHEDAMTKQRLAGFGVTEREAEVLAAVAERLRNREIAGRLHVSVRTVESHISAPCCASSAPLTGRRWPRWACRPAGPAGPMPLCPRR